MHGVVFSSLQADDSGKIMINIPKWHSSSELSNKKLLETSASLLVTSALLVVTMFAIRNRVQFRKGATASSQMRNVVSTASKSFLLLLVRHLLLLAMHLFLLASCYYYMQGSAFHRAERSFLEEPCFPVSACMGLSAATPAPRVTNRAWKENLFALKCFEDLAVGKAC